jgi:hypothetical protein
MRPAFPHLRDGRTAPEKDRAAQRQFKPKPPPQVYVIDFEQKKVSAYPIPRTPYGLSFSRDGRYLAVGSHEENVIIRIDLEAGRIDRRVKAQTHLQKFVTTASGDSLIVMSDHLGAPRSIEVRSWKDLSLQETIPISRLFPGVAGTHPSGIQATNDGRYRSVISGRFSARADSAPKPLGSIDEEGSGIALASPPSGISRSRC